MGDEAVTGIGRRATPPVSLRLSCLDGGSDTSSVSEDATAAVGECDSQLSGVTAGEAPADASVPSDSEDSGTPARRQQWTCSVCLTAGNFVRLCRACGSERVDDAAGLPRLRTEVVSLEPETETPSVASTSREVPVSPPATWSVRAANAAAARQQLQEGRRAELAGRAEERVHAARERVRRAPARIREERARMWSELAVFVLFCKRTARSQTAHRALGILRNMFAPKIRRWAVEARRRLLRQQMEHTMRRPSVQQLMRSELFARWPVSQVEGVLPLFQPAVFHAGDILFRPGQRWKDVYFVDVGQVEVVAARRPSSRRPSDACHNESVVARLLPGHVFGELSATRGRPPEVTARCAVNCGLWVLCPEMLQQLPPPPAASPLKSTRSSPRSSFTGRRSPSARLSHLDPSSPLARQNTLSPTRGKPLSQTVGNLRKQSRRSSPGDALTQVLPGLYSPKKEDVGVVGGALTSKDLVASCPALFDMLTEGTLQSLLSKAEPSVVFRGAEIQVFGARADRFVVLARGVAEVTAPAAFSSETKQLRAGHGFGVDILGPSRVYTATVRAATICDIWAIQRSHILDTILAPPQRPNDLHNPSVLLEMRRRVQLQLNASLPQITTSQLQAALEPCLPGVPFRVWKLLQGCAKPQVAGAGETLLRDGTPPSAALVVTHGTLVLFKAGNEPAGTVEAGQCLAMSEAVLGAPLRYAAHVRSHVAAVWTIPAEAAIEAMQTDTGGVVARDLSPRQCKEQQLRRQVGLIQTVLAAASKSFDTVHGDGASTRARQATMTLRSALALQLSNHKASNTRNEQAVASALSRFGRDTDADAAGGKHEARQEQQGREQAEKSGSGLSGDHLRDRALLRIRMMIEQRNKSKSKREEGGAAETTVFDHLSKFYSTVDVDNGVDRLLETVLGGGMELPVEQPPRKVTPPPPDAQGTVRPPPLLTTVASTTGTVFQQLLDNSECFLNLPTILRRAEDRSGDLECEEDEVAVPLQELEPEQPCTLPPLQSRPATRSGSPVTVPCLGITLEGLSKNSALAAALSVLPSKRPPTRPRPPRCAPGGVGNRPPKGQPGSIARRRRALREKAQRSTLQSWSKVAGDSASDACREDTPCQVIRTLSMAPRGFHPVEGTARRKQFAALAGSADGDFGVPAAAVPIGRPARAPSVAVALAGAVAASASCAPPQLWSASGSFVRSSLARASLAAVDPKPRTTQDSRRATAPFVFEMPAVFAATLPVPRTQPLSPRRPPKHLQRPFMAIQPSPPTELCVGAGKVAGRRRSKGAQLHLSRLPTPPPQSLHQAPGQLAPVRQRAVVPLGLLLHQANEAAGQLPRAQPDSPAHAPAEPSWIPGR
eukprot:TRINITY_DN4244_c0_g1_i1.p1 TRINITY_DN4244_c0_g1~~TRINITY_DN4244_c0_g1_i1.p1  ORF type:complete len:1346 (+),score=396.13 TRINITY_DN4244_c0_g1_i1:90-4127(+)